MMTYLSQHRPEEEYKWYVLYRAIETERPGILYGYVRAFIPEVTDDDADRVALQTFLELYDAGLIVLYWAEESIGYNVREDQLSGVDQLDREEIVRELSADHLGGRTENTLFFRNTPRGADVFASIPSEVVDTIVEKARAV